jgi:hypothetical protein
MLNEVKRLVCEREVCIVRDGYVAFASQILRFAQDDKSRITRPPGKGLDLLLYIRFRPGI